MPNRRPLVPASVSAANRSEFLSHAIAQGNFAQARYWARFIIADLNRMAAAGQDVTAARRIVFGLLNRLRSQAFA